MHLSGCPFLTRHPSCIAHARYERTNAPAIADHVIVPALDLLVTVLTSVSRRVRLRLHHIEAEVVNVPIGVCRQGSPTLVPAETEAPGPCPTPSDGSGLVPASTL